jgi:hypothetical protein
MHLWLGFAIAALVLWGVTGVTQKFRALRWRVHSPGNLREAMEALQTQEAGLDSYDR